MTGLRSREVKRLPSFAQLVRGRISTRTRGLWLRSFIVMLTAPGGVSVLDSAWQTQSTQYEFGDGRGLAAGHTERSFESGAQAASSSQAAGLSGSAAETEATQLPLPLSDQRVRFASQTAQQPRARGSELGRWEKDPARGSGPRRSLLSCLAQIPARSVAHHPVTHQRRLIPSSPLPQRAAARPSESERARALPRLPEQCAKSHFLPLNCFLLSVFLPPTSGSLNRECWLLW